ncbi:MAG: hypothetical protein IBX72_05930 [Nitrospirae bacterium]|nr:hypothetical protein [Nitrospirota bacterium]
MNKRNVNIIKAQFDEGIEFIPEELGRIDETPLKIWQETRGHWKNHPVFANMDIKAIIEWLRGPDAVDRNKS